MTDEYEEELDSPEEVDPVEETVEGDTVARGQYDKVVKEARSLRTKLRRTEFAKEFGDEVVELVPESLTLKEQKELAAKLKERFGATAQTRTDEGTESSELEAVEQPTDQERRAAALAREGSGSATTGKLSREEWLKLAGANPVAAQEAWSKGRVDLSGLREGLGRER